MPKKKRGDIIALIRVMDRIDKDPSYVERHKKVIAAFKFSRGLARELEAESDVS